MHLSRVEMTGFKSFADKTVIEFDKGLTAVVGPNGSGKSNLSEAIRWVLGEQSAKSLRGSKMEDIIFNGTQDRKAVNLAKVTLVLNNEDRYLDYDFSEISITRSYNRKGESAYYINHEQVRLKDIVDLLMDSGLGKNSFAMISQGKVESIFLSKPEERRAIFEEAAGVQKYQFRKQEAARKLGRSQDHLSRVRDIIHELKGQLKPLQRQRDTALQYQDLKGHLEELEISYAAYRLESDRQAWEEIKLQLEEIQKGLSKTLVALEEDKALQQETDRLYQALLLEIDERNQTLQDQHRLVEQGKANLAIKKQELAYSQTSAQDRWTYYQDHVQQLEQVETHLNQVKSRLSSLKVEGESLKAKQKRLEEEKQGHQGYSKEEEASLREELITYYQEEAKAHNQVIHFKQLIQQGQERLKSLNRGRTEQSDLEVDLQNKIQTYQAQVSKKEESLSKLQSDLQASLEDWRRNQEAKQEVQARLFHLDRQYRDLSARQKSLRLMQAQYEGYYGGVKAIMKAKNQLSGIVGPVADLISVEPAYQVAIDTALGGAMQHIVVENDQAARQAISHLKERKLGRATFLPLTNIKGRQIETHIIKQASQNVDFVGLAADLVRAEGPYQPIVSNLLGTTLVMKSTLAAQELARQLRFSTRIVTLEGDLLTPGGAITGGRQSRSGNSMLSRQTELNQVQKQLEQVGLDKEEADRNWQALEKAEGDIRQAGEKKRQAVTQVEGQKKDFQQALEQAQTRLNMMVSQNSTWQAELTSIQKQIAQAQEDLEASAKRETEMEEKIQEGNRILEGLSQSQEEKNQVLQALDAQINDTRTQVALNQQEYKQAKMDEQQLESQLVQIRTLIYNFEGQKSSDEATQEQIREDLKGLKLEIEREEAKRDQIQGQLDEEMKQRQDLQVRLTTLDQQVSQGQMSLQGAYQKEARLQANLERLEENMDQQLLYLSQEYQLTFEAAKEQAKDLEDWEFAKKKIKDLKQAIHRLGPINLEAIEAYEDLNQRYTYLVEQEEDLLSAMGQLQETMDKMDEEVIKRFSTSFNQINNQFQKTFKSLFGGGQASLELTDPDNLLTTGVDIIAQPPGKRKQNLALLSGGERAFTAIALLFAILETKPVPFCILDEVEAALDDANVWRYGEYLQHFTQSTQFIVVTHRKGTMEHADVLYGVTMEKSGVSKLASVRLSQVEE